MVDKEEITQRLPYRLREPFLTTTELALFHLLTQLVDGRYLVFPKVALNDIFFIVRPNENVHFFNKIFRKHVGFLLCEPETLTPVFGVEMVRPISKNDTRERDKFMSEMFTDAGLPLVHVPSAEHYDPSEIITLFQLAVAKIGGTASLRLDNSSDSVPHCPECGKMMVLRIYREGVNAGKEYYGCIDSPRCSGVVAIN